MALLFVDESTLNPLPPGIQVTIVLPDGTIIGQGYTVYGGKVNLQVQGAVSYVAVFSGTQAPNVSIAFTGNPAGGDTTVTVLGYYSPSLSLPGYTDLFFRAYPRGVLSRDAWQPGTPEYALFSSLAKAPATIDAQATQLQGAMRAFTCMGADLDSWAADFFGSALPRYPNEDDPTYLSRILAAFGPRCTLAAIQQLVIQFYAATLTERILESQQNLGYDTTGSYDNIGGFDVFVPAQSAASLMPSVSVWDAWSLPARAQTFNIAPPKFVISIAFSDAGSGWFLDYSTLDFTTTLIDAGTPSFSTTPPDARLGALVSLVKAAGCQPVYETSIGS